MAKIETALRPMGSTQEDQKASLLTGIHSEQYLKLIMYRQLRLSLALFGVFVIILAGLPLVNYYLPMVATIRIYGFTLSWLVLGVLFYPVTWAVAYIYVKRSLELEHRIAQEVAQSKGR